MFKGISALLAWMGRHFKGVLLLILLLWLFLPKSSTQLHPANLQEIELFGPIVDARTIVESIEEARKNPAIKGVLLNVNSPGGAVPPSIEISYAIRRLQAQKPVVAYASGIMASGSYYSSIYAGDIIANPGAIVGSIGVIMESANLEELLAKLGVKPQVVKEGTYKEAGTPTRAWTPQERAELERLTHDTYTLFVSDVAKARGLELNASNRYADAHIFLASKAKEVGLIDAVGTLEDAKQTLIKRSHVSLPQWQKKDRFESFLERLGNKVLLQMQGLLYGLKASL